MNLLPFEAIVTQYEETVSALSNAQESVKHLLDIGGITESKARPILDETAPSFISFLFNTIDNKWGYDEYGYHPGYVCDYDQYSTDDIWKELSKDVQSNPEPFLKKLHAIASKEGDYLEFINKGIALAKSQ